MLPKDNKNISLNLKKTKCMTTNMQHVFFERNYKKLINSILEVKMYMSNHFISK